MKKYETVIHIVTEGKDVFEAGEKAGELIDIAKLIHSEEDILVNCEPTRAVIHKEMQKVYGEKKSHSGLLAYGHTYKKSA